MCLNTFQTKYTLDSSLQCTQLCQQDQQYYRPSLGSGAESAQTIYRSGLQVPKGHTGICCRTSCPNCHRSAVLQCCLLPGGPQ